MKTVYRYLAGFCVATVLTQILVLSVLTVRGNLDRDALVTMIALVNGIDISGERLRAIVHRGEQHELPSFDEVLERRALDGLQMDLRRQSQVAYYEQLSVMEERLRARQEQFDRRREAFRLQLEDMEKGNQERSLAEVQQILQSLPSQQAKDQLAKMIEEGNLSEVVAIVKAMPADKRKKILSEFSDPAEVQQLHEILQRIGGGDPERQIIDQALDGS